MNTPEFQAPKHIRAVAEELAALAIVHKLCAALFVLLVVVLFIHKILKMRPTTTKK